MARFATKEYRIDILREVDFTYGGVSVTWTLVEAGKVIAGGRVEDLLGRPVDRITRKLIDQVATTVCKKEDVLPQYLTVRAMRG